MIQRWKRWTTVVIILTVVLILGGCSGDVSLRTVRYKGHLSVGYIAGSYLNEPVFRVIEAVAQRMELSVQLVETDALSWQADLHNGDIDLMIDAYNDTDVRSDVLFTARVLLAKPPGEQGFPDGGRIGVLDAGAVQQAAADVRHFHTCRYSYYGQADVLVFDYFSGRLDGMLISEYDWIHQGMPEDALYDIVHHRDVSATFRSGDQKLLNVFNAHLAELSQEENIHDIAYGNS